MVKIFLTCRNRLAITKKCIEALKKHSKLPHQIYVYDNLTNHKIDEHFEYFRELYKKEEIAQITFNTKESTFNAFSKAVSSNQFGLLHEQDPNKDSYDFLLFLDNDIIVTDEWDIILKDAWNKIKKHTMNDVRVISQLPGGIKQRIKLKSEIMGCNASLGKLGGSGFWSVKPDFFRVVGFLNLKQLVGHDKKHDQLYWNLIEKSTNGERYILGLDKKLGIHCGSIVGSVCNTLTRFKKDPNKLEKIKFKDNNIEKISFDDFYNYIKNNKSLLNDW